MPFTPTHVLAILPIAAFKRFPFSALVIGSMIPDLPLFLSVSPTYEQTHSIRGLFTACLPLGLGCFVLFDRLMRRPLFELLPDDVRRRTVSVLVGRKTFGMRVLGWASVAVVVGASTHVFWDSFTHAGRWGTRLVPVLNETVLRVGGHAVPGFKVFQYGSTVIGLPALAGMIAMWLSRQAPAVVEDGTIIGGTARVVIWVTVLSVTVSVGLYFLAEQDGSTYRRIGSSITKSGLALMVAILVYGLVFQLIRVWSVLRKEGKGVSPGDGSGMV